MALGFDYSSSGPRLDDQAREELRGIAEQIVQSFLGEPNRSLSTKRQLRWGRKGSFALNVAGDKAGLWYDHENEIGGDVIEFIRQQRGYSIGEAIDEALTYLGPSASWSSSTAPKTSQPAEPEEDDAARINRALCIWSEVQPVPGTLTEQYLVGRGIQVPDEALNVLGFHWHCPFGEGRRAPALLALIQEIITGEPIAIHRRELTPDAAQTFGITSEIIAVTILSRWADTCTCTAVATPNWGLRGKGFSGLMFLSRSTFAGRPWRRRRSLKLRAFTVAVGRFVEGWICR